MAFIVADMLVLLLAEVGVTVIEADVIVVLFLAGVVVTVVAANMSLYSFSPMLSPQSL